jgi:tetratricopeptide (TPR) repeat protein
MPMRKIVSINSISAFVLCLFGSLLAAQPAYVYHEKGQALMKQNNYGGAISEFTNAINKDVTFFESYCERGRCQQALGKTDLALADFNKTVSLNPKYAPGFYYRGKLQQQLGKDNEAIADYTQAIKLNPDFPDSYASRGLLYARTGKTDLALADLNKAISYDAKDANLFFVRAGVYRDAKKYNEALADYSSCIKLNPARGDAHFEQGKIYAAQKNHLAAVNSYTQAIANKVTSEEVYRLRAESNMAQNKPAEAVKDYTQLIDVLKTKDLEIVRSRGNCYMQLANYPAAVKDFSRLITAKRDDIPALLARADANAKQGKTKYNMALTDYNAVLRIDAKNADALRGIARLHFANEKWQLAIDKLTEAIAIKAEAGDYYLRAQCYARLQNQKACCADITKAEQMGHPDAAKDKSKLGCM